MGCSFDDLTQKDIGLMMNHINSYSREKLNDKSPYESFSFFYGKEILERLGAVAIAPNEILLRNPASQVGQEHLGYWRYSAMNTPLKGVAFTQSETLIFATFNVVHPFSPILHAFMPILRYFTVNEQCNLHQRVVDINLKYLPYTPQKQLFYPEEYTSIYEDEASIRFFKSLSTAT